MRFAELSDDALFAEWRGRNKVLEMVTTHPDRDHLPPLVVESLIDWAKEPAAEADARNARLLGFMRRLAEVGDPMPAYLPGRSIEAVHAALSGVSS